MAPGDIVERFYSGEAASVVTVRESEKKRPLDRRLDLTQQSAVDFSWGNDESGAAQLAVALLADAVSDDVVAMQLHHEFTRRVVNIFPDRWTITRSRILAHVEMIKYIARIEDLHLGREQTRRAS